MKRKVATILTAVALLAAAAALVAVDGDGPPGGPDAPSPENVAVPPVGTEPGESGGSPNETYPGGRARWRTVLITVCSRADGAPVTGATVSLETGHRRYRAIGVTGKDGTLRFSPPGAGRFGVMVRREGFLRGTRWFGTEDREGILRLETGVSVIGRVIDAADGSPVAGAVVFVRDEETLDEIDGPVLSDTRGRFTVAGVRKGYPFSLEVMKPGYGPAWVRDRREASGSEIVVRLGGGARVSGRVLSADGAPVAGAEVFLLLEGNDPRQAFLRMKSCEMPGLASLNRTVADGDGWYEVRGLPVPSTWLLAARASRGRSAATRVFFTEEGARERRDFALRPLPVIRVLLTGPDGAPVREARVQCRGAGSCFGFVVQMGKDEASAPEADGAWLLLPGGDGPFTVRAEAPGHRPVEREVETDPGTEVEVAMVLGTGVALDGAVLGPEDKPVAAARVTFRIRGREGVVRQSETVETGPDGSFRIEGLQQAAGTVNVDCDDGRRTTRRDVRPGEEPVTIRMTPRATIRGRFAPVPDAATILASFRDPMGGGFSGDRRLAPDGSFVMHPSSWILSRAGGFHLTLAPKGWPPVEFRDLQLAPGETLDLGEIALAEGVAVAGTVTDHRRAPVPGARVQLSMKMLFDAPIVYTDERGSFRFNGLASAPAWVSVETDRLLVPATRKVADTATAGHLCITLAPAGAAALTVVGPEGMPVSGLTIVLAPAKGEGASFHGMWETDSGGRMRILAPPGRYRVRHYGGPEQGEGPVVEVKAGRETAVRVTVLFKGPTGEVWTDLPR